MKPALALVLATGAFGGALGLSPQAQALPSTAHAFAFEGPRDDTPKPTLVEDDDDEDGGWLWNGDVGDDDSSGDCDDTEDPACTQGGAGNAAPAGTVAPPKNGLFTDGTAPQVKNN